MSDPVLTLLTLRRQHSRAIASRTASDGRLGQSEQVSATEQTIDLDRATIRYRVTGDGPTLVFVHGVWVAGPVWNDVVERLDGMRCIVPTWPLGAHPDPAPTADLSARATAKRIPDFLEALDLRDVTLVGNDTGGGLCLAALGAERSGLQRISRLVLTNCDSYEHFPPKGFDKMVALMRRSSALGSALLRFFASSLGQRVFLKGVCVEPPRGARARAIFGAFPDSAATRRDALRVTQSLEPSVTLDAVGALRAFSKPVLLAWGAADRLFPLDHARRLKADFADARLDVMDEASTFVMLDRPDELAATITAFVSETPSNA
jgi:pimeloyl-ACP methyl ester carboxylesterase